MPLNLVRMPWVETIVLGILGAIVGGFIANLLNVNADGSFVGLILSVIGAIALLFIYEMVTGKRRIG